MAKNSWVTIEIQEAELRRLRTKNAVLRRANDDLFKANAKLQAKINRLDGIAILSLWYTYSWGQGIYNYWIRGINA